MIVTGSGLIRKFLSIISTIVLARLLDPSDFGLIALANILISGVNTFSGLGLTQALIATHDDKIKASFHAFIATFAAGLLLSVGMFSFADTYAGFYNNSTLADICRWMTPIILISTLLTVPDALLVRAMLFGRRAASNIIAALAGIVTSISMAYFGYGVWSLVLGALAVASVRLIGIALSCPEWQWLKLHRWDAGIMNRLIKFGSRNMSTGVVQYYYNNLDFFVVGKALGTQQLGFYSQGFTLSNIAVTSISSVVNSVLLPSYRRIEADKQRLAAGYLKSLQMVAVVTVPIAMGLFVIAPDAVVVLLGEKWRDAIPILQIFAFMSLIRPLSGTTSPLFFSLGLPGFNLRTALIQGFALTILVFPGVRWGISGVAIAVVTAFAIGFVHNVYLACFKTDLRISPADFIKALIPSLSAGISMVILVELIKLPINSFFGEQPSVVSLCILILFGSLTYTASLRLVNRRLFMDIVDLVNSSLPRSRRN